jgi:poly(3-hydroxybutyrate) depolymerase
MESVTLSVADGTNGCARLCVNRIDLSWNYTVCMRMHGLRAVSLSCLLISGISAQAEVLKQTRTINGLKVEYRVVLPAYYNPANVYPAVLSFIGGSQDIDQADGEIRSTWQAAADKRGYIVVLPAAPEGQLFFEGGERIFPDFLKLILSEYKILNGKFNMAGHSNGGISAFHVAALYPQYFLSITGFPGYLPDATPEHLRAISKMCIYMYAGSLDRDWTEEMERQAKVFRAQGMSVSTAIEKGQPHHINTLYGDGVQRLFDQFDQARKGCS